jgi:Ran GTPase-activating protein (RanGAP) involved in mRNA processing and transport
MSYFHSYVNTHESVAYVTEYLESDPPIHQIELSHNRLNDDDAILISQALKRNIKLKLLSLHSNKFTSIGVKTLLTCIFDSSSLNSLSKSNHNLEELMLFWYSGYIGKLDHYIDRLLELDRIQKIMLALQDKDSLLQYLANVPVELIPEVLAFPLRKVDHQREHRHLSIVYSTMRWWNMPLLYSYHNCVKSDTKRKRVDLLVPTI